MNGFYDIAPEAHQPDNSFQLRHLGLKQHVATFGILNAMIMVSDHIATHNQTRYRCRRLDGLFANMIYKTNPPYDIELLLNHHYNKFIEVNHNGHKLFLRHIKYVVVPLLEKHKQHEVYVDLVNEWLNEKERFKAQRIKY